MLGVFAKYWDVGKVKTRLSAKTSPEFAAAAHQLFLQTTLSRFQGSADEDHLVFAPADAATRFEQSGLCDDWTLTAQTDGDLGRRMTSFIDRSLADNANKVVLIGADSPNLPLSHVSAAFEWLDTHPVVLSPTEDGGYCLIGVNQSIPSIFVDMPWSTDRVYEITLERLEAAGMTPAKLPPWYDVDEFNDLQRLLGDVSNDPEYANLVQSLREHP